MMNPISSDDSDVDFINSPVSIENELNPLIPVDDENNTKKCWKNCKNKFYVWKENTRIECFDEHSLCNYLSLVLSIAVCFLLIPVFVSGIIMKNVGMIIGCIIIIFLGALYFIGAYLYHRQNRTSTLPT